MLNKNTDYVWNVWYDFFVCLTDDFIVTIRMESGLRAVVGAVGV